MKNFSKQPIALALGAAFALSAMGAQASVFQTADLGAGYMVAGAEGKTGEHKCGEGKCGAAKFDAMDTNKDGMLSKDEFAAGHKAKKADGKCGEGKCGADKKKADGKCGEGKCGGKK